MFTLPNLPYPFEALEPHIDEQTMQIHHTKHHQAYVDNLNKALEGHQDLLSLDINELIKNLNEVPEEVRTKVRNNAGGHANHSLFWTIMAPPTSGGVNPQGAPLGPELVAEGLAEAIKNTFGDFNTFKEKFSATGLGRFGSGWAWLSLENGKLKIEDSPNQDSPLMEGRIPLLSLDVWEHAYYLKYQNRRAEYIEAWWNVVNWPEVARRFAEAA